MWCRSCWYRISQTYKELYIRFAFVIFDVEAVFIFPWAINLEKLGYFGLIDVCIYIYFVNWTYMQLEDV